jgi:triphosphoribosyl-dephospho-CoA synthase
MSAPLHRQWSATRVFAEAIADRAVDALRAEAFLTPKPALVDRRGCGAHRDLDLGRLLCSAAALRESFGCMAECAYGRTPSRSLREDLGRIGRRAESAMLAATNGSNAHRGAIWMLGLLTAARVISARESAPGAVAAVAAGIARFTDRYAPHAATHGSRVRVRYGVLGARGEAIAGFPHVIEIGLPALESARRRGVDEECARLDALMAIMAVLEDTCLLHRGGRGALLAAQAGARAVLENGGTSTVAGRRALLALDRDLLERWASPGGCADVLAACLFLDEETSLAIPENAVLNGGLRSPWNN